MAALQIFMRTDLIRNWLLMEKPSLHVARGTNKVNHYISRNRPIKCLFLFVPLYKLGFSINYRVLDYIYKVYMLKLHCIFFLIVK